MALENLDKVMEILNEIPEQDWKPERLLVGYVPCLSFAAQLNGLSIRISAVGSLHRFAGLSSESYHIPGLTLEVKEHEMSLERISEDDWDQGSRARLRPPFAGLYSRLVDYHKAKPPIPEEMNLKVLEMKFQRLYEQLEKALAKT